MSQWVVHRDESFYTAPLTFDPDRWTPEFERVLPKYAYFPFGGGPRVCIGKEVAMVEATGVLTALASEFNVSLEDPDGLTPWPTVTLRPKGEVWAQVTRDDESVTRELWQRKSLKARRS
jgi:cytochrome P450